MVKPQNKYQERTYRKSVSSKRFFSFCVSYEETDLYISIDNRSYDPQMQQFIQDRIQLYRKEIETFASIYPAFYSSLVPIQSIETSSQIIKKMLTASNISGIGPMAGVAGAFSECIGKDLIKAFDCNEVIIENGGDIFLHTVESVTVSIFAGSSVFSEKLGLCIPGGISPLGICTSAGTVGHSLSFGKADAVVIVCKNTQLADAYATKYANMIKEKSDINRIIEEIGKKEDVISSVIIKEDMIGICGNFELIKLKKEYNEQDKQKKRRTI